MLESIDNARSTSFLFIYELCTIFPVLCIQ